MKRYGLLTIILILLLCGCGHSKKNSDKLQIVVSIAPEYDWVRNIVGEDDGVELTLLTKNGADMHSYEPTAEDIVTISTCDVFIYVGGESDAWAFEALKNKTNRDMQVINLLDLLGERALLEEHKEGMQGEEEEEPETDEHVWLSLKNAQFLCEEITEALAQANPKSANNYKANCTAYVQKLNELDNKYLEVVKTSKNKTILVADRFPFRYLVEDYELDYYAAFSGCAADSEASFETLTFLAKKLKELDLKYIVKIENSDDRLANTIIQSSKLSDVEIVVINSLQNISLEQLNSGTSYLGLMEDNLLAFEKALN